MQDAFVPLIVSAGVFFVFVVWRTRPLAPLVRSWKTGRRDAAGALSEAKERIVAATDAQARARALCDAAEIAIKGVRGRASATGFYLRALRSDPTSADIVRRAAIGLARSPRTLEGLLWRYLASIQWKASPEATVVALDALCALYEGPLRNALRARALANARQAF